MLSKAGSQVMIAIQSFAREFTEEAMPLLAGLRWSSVKVQVMITSKPSRKLHGLVSDIEVRERDDMFGGGVIVDGKEALLFLGEEDKPSLVIWSNHIGLVKFAKDYFQYLWNSSKEL